MAVLTAITFQSRTVSAFATAHPNKRVAVNTNTPKFLILISRCILFMLVPPDSGKSISGYWYPVEELSKLTVAEGIHGWGFRMILRTTAMTEQCQSLRDNTWGRRGVRGNATRKAA